MRESPVILVATDNPSQRALIVSLLQNAKYRVYAASNGYEALAYVQEAVIDALIADISLDGVNGLDVCRQLRAQPTTRHIPILLISPSATRDDDVLSALLAGSDDCLATPFRPQELTLKLRHMLERQHWAVERQRVVENLVWLANSTDLFSSGEQPKYEPPPEPTPNGKPATADDTAELPTPTELFRQRPSETEWDEVEDAMQQALRYFQEVHSGEEEVLIRSAMSRLSTAVAQASLYRQARSHVAGLQEANEKLKELDRLRSEFTNAIVHDIRSPLGSVISTLELIEMELQGKKPDMGELRELINGARQVSEKMISLINELLDFSKMEAGVLQLEFVPIAPHEIIQEAGETWAVVSKRKNVSLSYGCDTNLPKVMADARSIQRALMNLLSNAIKFTPEGGQIWIEARLVEGQQVDAGYSYVVISVIDTGEGIPAQELPYIFDPYYQARSRTGSIGTGLGLAIVKRIAAAHGGNVSVRSQVGVGSAFSIVLPVAMPSVPKSEPQPEFSVDDTNILQAKPSAIKDSSVLSNSSRSVTREIALGLQPHSEVNPIG
ncbi:MAG TPA: ATP-binding protein [Acidobacteriota bacterium]|nr:ATP-binding protein [Acidobacteriota bacterium]